MKKIRLLINFISTFRKRIFLFPFLLAAIMLTNTLSAQNMTRKNTLPGAWLGSISIQGSDLRIVFLLKLMEKDSLFAYVNFPENSPKEIPFGRVILNEKKLVIQDPDDSIEYNGTITGDSTMVGTWTEKGVIFLLILRNSVQA
jgi:hypothetical protein